MTNEIQSAERRLQRTANMNASIANNDADAGSLRGRVRPALLDLFCGVGGWSKSFAERGWNCVGVDIAALGYPYSFVQCSVLDLTPDFLDSFDAITSSPPCEEFARAWLPWLRGDKKPERWAIDLLEWSVKLCAGRHNRITECSNFSARHVPGGTRFESYTLWGDVPLLMPQLPRGKMAKSGMKPELRAEIPPALADWIADNYTRAYRSKNMATDIATSVELQRTAGSLRRVVGASGHVRYWRLKNFNSQSAQNKWVEKHRHKNQIVPLFVNNGYAVEYRSLIQL